MWLYVVGLLAIFFLFRWCLERLTVKDLSEKYVLITGCGSGFGNLLARQLDHRGLRVLAACHTEESAKLLKEVTSQRLQTTVVEVTDSDSVANMAHWVKEQVGSNGLWGLVNNAAVSQPSAPNEWLTRKDFERVVDVNLLGSIIDVTLSLTPLVRKARGRIINVTSICGRISITGGGYCISKCGAEAFSDSLRRELSPFGVKVIIIEPGFFHTTLTTYKNLYGGMLAAWEQSSPEIHEIYGKAYLARFEQNIRELKQSTNLSLVTDCMEHALMAKYPRTRYAAGWDAKLFFIPLSYWPTVLSDAMLNVKFEFPEPVKHD